MEILGNEIFRHCLPDHDHFRDDIDPKLIQPSTLRHAPLLLCNVCSAWREIALSTRVLWSQISVVVKEVEGDSEPRPSPGDDGWYEGIEEEEYEFDSEYTRELTPSVATIEQWLERSGNHPLWLSFVDLSYDDDYDDYDDPFDSALKPFMAHVNRWHTVRFIVPHWDFPNPLYSIPVGGALALSAAFIGLADPDAPSYDSSDEEYQSHNFAKIVTAMSCLLSPSPHIRRMSWSLSYSILPRLSMHWEGLTDITISSPMLIADVVGLLQLCQNLQDLRVAEPPSYSSWMSDIDPDSDSDSDNHSDAHSDDTSSAFGAHVAADAQVSPFQTAGKPGGSLINARPHVTHSRLRSFDISSKMSLGNLFDRLTLPALQRIAVTGARRTSKLLLLLERSQVNLSHLRLVDPRLAEDDIISLLRAMPSLIDITLINDPQYATRISQDLIALLTQTYAANNMPSPCLCPMLRSITWSGIHIDSVNGSLSDMVASRKPPSTIPEPLEPGRLERIHINFHKDDFKRLQADRERLHTMSRNGLTITLQGPPQTARTVTRSRRRY